MIVLNDSTIKYWVIDHIGVTSNIIEILIILSGPEGGFPTRISNSFFAKNLIPPLNKSHVIKKDVSKAKDTVISNIERGGQILPPPS